MSGAANPAAQNEAIIWHACAEQMPDDDTTVLGYHEGWDEVEPVYHDGERWVLCASGYTIETGDAVENPTHWAHLPIGPGRSAA